MEERRCLWLKLLLVVVQEYDLVDGNTVSVAWFRHLKDAGQGYRDSGAGWLLFRISRQMNEMLNGTDEQIVVNENWRAYVVV